MYNTLVDCATISKEIFIPILLVILLIILISYFHVKKNYYIKKSNTIDAINRFGILFYEELEKEGFFKDEDTKILKFKSKEENK